MEMRYSCRLLLGKHGVFKLTMEDGAVASFHWVSPMGAAETLMPTVMAVASRFPTRKGRGVARMKGTHGGVTGKSWLVFA